MLENWSIVLLSVVSENMALCRKSCSSKSFRYVQSETCHLGYMILPHIYLTKILRLTEVQNTKYDQIPDEQARKALVEL